MIGCTLQKHTQRANELASSRLVAVLWTDGWKGQGQAQIKDRQRPQPLNPNPKFSSLGWQGRNRRQTRRSTVQQTSTIGNIPSHPNETIALTNSRVERRLHQTMDSANEPTNPWPHPDSEHFWRLAHKIEDKQLWAGYLTEQEHTIWRKALRRRDTFTAFLEGRGEPFEASEMQESAETVNGAPKTEDNGEKVTDPVTTAFRARVMLFEASVRKLFPSRTGEDLDFNVDDILEPTDDAVPLIEEKPKTRQVEDDDYDDEDEEEEESTALIPAPQSSNQDADSSMDNIGNS